MERMRLRSSISQEERELAAKEKAQQQVEKYQIKPLISYSGSVKYCTTFTDCAFICDNLLNVVGQSDEFVVGFDMEWPFSFQTGSGTTAVIQISSSLTECFILHVYNFKSLPKSLTEFLKHPNVRLTGVNIKNDIRKLARDFKNVPVEDIIVNCIELGVQANSVLPVTCRWSMANLVEYCLKMSINKDGKVRRSKWHVMPLTKEQQLYAATDAYVSLKLYYHLKALEAEKTENDKNIQNLLL